MKTAVIDTSALLRLFIPDGAVPSGTEAAVRAVDRGDASLLAPEIILAEAGQVLHKKVNQGILTVREADELLDDLLAIPIQLCSHRPLLSRALEIARKQRLTVYDALFLTLAEKYNSSLLTADVVLRKAARKLSLPSGFHQ